MQKSAKGKHVAAAGSRGPNAGKKGAQQRPKVANRRPGLTAQGMAHSARIVEMRSRRDIPRDSSMEVAVPKMSAMVAAQGRTTASCAILSSFALPFEAPVCRIAGGIRTTKTATAKPHQEITPIVGARATVDPWSFGLGNSFVAMSRNSPLHAITMPCFASTAGSKTANAPAFLFLFSNPAGAGLGQAITTFPFQGSVQNYNLPFIALNHAAGFSTWSGDALSAANYAQTRTGLANDQRLVLMADWQTITWTFSTTSAVPTGNTLEIQVFLDYFDGQTFTPSIQNAAMVPYTGTGVNMPNTNVILTGVPAFAAGWYGFHVTIQTKTSTGQEVLSGQGIQMVCSNFTYGASNGQTAVLCQYSLPQVSTKANTVENSRCVGFSALLTNLTPAINMGGEVAGVQLPPGENWLTWMRGGPTPGQFITGNPAQNISVVEGFASHDGKLGCHLWTKPADLIGLLSFRKYFDADSGTGQIVDSFAPLSSYDGDGILAISCANASTQTFRLRYCYQIEYATYDMWVERRYPDFSDAAYTSAFSKLNKLPQFTENFDHVKLFDAIDNITDRVYNSLTNARGKLGKFAPRAGDLLDTLIGRQVA